MPCASTAFAAKTLPSSCGPQLRIKICDFAFSKFKQQLEQKSIVFESRVGTPQWMAPEVLRGDDYSFSADLYSFGVIVWEMVHRIAPFKNMHQAAIICQVPGTLTDDPNIPPIQPSNLPPRQPSG